MGQRREGKYVFLNGTLNDVQNNHSLTVNTVRYEVDSSSGAAITGGSLGTDVYNLGEFQLHWGSKEGQGSEHTINGER